MHSKQFKQLYFHYDCNPMEKVLRPERLDANSSSAEAVQDWTHWKATFTNFWHLCQ